MNVLALLAFVLSVLAYLGESKACYGYRTCYNKAITSHNYCYGYQSCMYARPYSKGYSSYCRGFQSCYGLKMTRTYQGGNVGCGYQGCQSATIYTTYARSYGHLSYYGASVWAHAVYGYGSYGLHSTHIRPIARSLTVYLFGMHTGYNTRIYCYAGDTCRIYCYNDACRHTYFYCYNHATCHFSVSTSSYPPKTYGGTASKPSLTDEQIESARKQNERTIAASAEADMEKLKFPKFPKGNSLPGPSYLTEALPSIGGEDVDVDEMEAEDVEEHVLPMMDEDDEHLMAKDDGLDELSDMQMNH